jgi:peroxiredoxin
MLSGVFPVLAAQLVSEHGVTSGRALAISYGAPYVAMELARQTDFQFDVLVADSVEAAIAGRRIEDAGLMSHFSVRIGRADFLPFRDESFDLVLTRDAMRFWKHKAAVYREIDRVLKPGGQAVLGAGLGTAISDAEAELLWASVQGWRNRTDHRPWAATLPYPERLDAGLLDAGIRGYTVQTEGHCNCRTWVRWRKAGEAGTPPRQRQQESRPSKPEAGGPAPDFTLPDQQGEPVTLSALRGEVVMLDFWAVNCRSCLNMMKQLEPVHERLRGQGCRFYAVNIDWRKEKLDGFLEKHEIPYPVLYDAAGVAKAYGVMGIPHFVLIDRDGILRHRILGGTDRTATRIELALLELLQEGGPG